MEGPETWQGRWCRGSCAARGAGLPQACRAELLAMVVPTRGDKDAHADVEDAIGCCRVEGALEGCVFGPAVCVCVCVGSGWQVHRWVGGVGWVGARALSDAMTAEQPKEGMPGGGAANVGWMPGI